MNNFKELLKEQFKDLSEESLTTISEAFISAVEDKAKLQVESAIIVKDEEHAKLVEELKTSIDADHTAKLQKLVEALDQDHAFKFESAIAKLDNGHAKMLKEALTAQDSNYAAKLQQAVNHIDESHTAKLSEIVEAIDADHSNKIKIAFGKIDEKHTGMLQKIVNKYEALLTEEAVSYKEGLITDISDYMNVYLEKLVPKDQISEAVENIKARKTLNAIRDLVSISEEYIDTEVKEALQDGKKIIDSLKKELNEAIKSNVEVNKKLNQTESAYLLEQKTKSLTPATKAHVNKLLKNKTPEFIQENFQYVVEMFEKDIDEKEEDTKERVMSKRISESIDRPEIVSESENIGSYFTKNEDSSVGGYLSEMKKKDGSRLSFTR